MFIYDPIIGGTKGKGLGIAPLLVGGAIVAGGVGAWEWFGRDIWNAVTTDPEKIKVPMPNRPPFSTPQAPITGEELRNWNPDRLQAAEMRAFDIGLKWEENIRKYVQGNVTDESESGINFNTLALILAGIAGVLIVTK